MMNRRLLILAAGLMTAVAAEAVITKHYSFRPRQTSPVGGASVIVPVPAPIADAMAVARAKKKEKELSIIGKVVMVADGDTLTVQPNGGDKHIVRLSGTSAPKGAEPGAVTALNSLSTLLKDKKVTVKYRQKDKSGVVFGVVWYGKVNVNKSMVVSGFSKATDKTYEEDQRQAKLAKRGIWADAK